MVTERVPDKTKTLAQTIRQAILAGDYAHGEMLPSEREFMLRHDLSRTTVRRAIELLVKEGRVVRRAGSGSFVGTAEAENGRRAPPSANGTPLISLIVPTFSNPLYGEIIDGIEREAREHGLKLLTNQTEYSFESESRQLATLASDPDVRGAIVVPIEVSTSSVGARRFQAAGKPLVYMGRWPDDAAADGVSADYLTSGRIAVEHLLAQGHKHIAYVEGSPHLPGFSLFDGYSLALKKAGLPVNLDLVRIIDLPSEAAGRRAVEDLLAEKIRFSAIFARNDVTALGVVQALHAAGVKIPGQAAVASVNDSLLARSMDPPLTSVRIHPEVLGRVGFRLLRDRLTGSHDGPPLHILVVPSLTKRLSTISS